MKVQKGNGIDAAAREQSYGSGSRHGPEFFFVFDKSIVWSMVYTTRWETNSYAQTFSLCFLFLSMFDTKAKFVCVQHRPDSTLLTIVLFIFCF